LKSGRLIGLGHLWLRFAGINGQSRGGILCLLATATIAMAWVHYIGTSP